MLLPDRPGKYDARSYHLFPNCLLSLMMSSSSLFVQFFYFSIGLTTESQRYLHCLGLRCLKRGAIICHFLPYFSKHNLSKASSFFVQLVLESSDFILTFNSNSSNLFKTSKVGLFNSFAMISILSLPC